MRLALLVTTMLLCSCNSEYQGSRQITVEAMETLLEAKLPLGSDLDVVRGFLLSQGIEHGVIEKECKICAIIRDTKKTTLISESITLDFIFDSNGKLQSWEVEKVLTGP